MSEQNERLDRIECAVQYLAECLEQGSWQGVSKQVYEIIYPIYPVKD